jgi:hypothetical protein
VVISFSIRDPSTRHSVSLRTIFIVGNDTTI